MTKVFVFFIIGLSSLLVAAHAKAYEAQIYVPPSDSKKTARVFDYGGGIAVFGRHFDERATQQTAVTFGSYFEGRYRLIDETLRLDFAGVLNLNSQRSQSRYRDARFEDGLFLRLAQIYWRPITDSVVALGALNQATWVPSSLLVYHRRAFPGVGIQYCLCQPSWEIKFKAQRVIPTSTSFEAERTEQEPLPVLGTETVTFQWLGKNFFEVEVFLTHFQFANLPAQVAAMGLLHGNTVFGGGDPASSRFVYSYGGLSFGGRFDFALTSRLRGFFLYEGIENMKAPRSVSTGHMVESGIRWFGKSFHLSPSLGFFYIERDTSPAFYNWSRLAHNNRAGYRMRVRADRPGNRFGMVVDVISAKTIEAHSEQSDRFYILVGLEADYGSL